MMFNYKLFLLNEWYGRNKQENTSMQVFGSFLDRNSLEFVLKLVQIEIIHNNTTNNTINNEFDYMIPPVVFIFFPVSPSNFVNSVFKSHILDLLNASNLPNSSQIDEIIDKAYSFVEKRQRQYSSYIFHQSLNWNSKISSKQQEILLNRFLFGNLEAKFANLIKQFPLILLKNRTYNGIPLNFSVDSFIDKIICKELNSISAFFNQKKRNYENIDDEMKPIERLTLRSV